jgi:hypothetical protein
VEDWADNPIRVADVITMVLLSIRMQWSGVGTQMCDVRENGEASKCLWGFKRNGYRYVQAKKTRLFARVQACRNGDIWVEDLMRDLLRVPGLGMAKAGFVVQLLTGEAGCMDMHNIERFGLKPDTWAVRKYKAVDKQLREVDEKIAHYLDLVDACGGTEVLWDEWCEYVAASYSTFHNADDVSRRHYIYLLDIPAEEV